jgi:hypothetical protein
MEDQQRPDWGFDCPIFQEMENRFPFLPLTGKELLRYRSHHRTMRAGAGPRDTH